MCNCRLSWSWRQLSALGSNTGFKRNCIQKQKLHHTAAGWTIGLAKKLWGNIAWKEPKWTSWPRQPFVSSLIKLTLWVLASTALFNKKAAHAWIRRWFSLQSFFTGKWGWLEERLIIFFMCCIHQNESNSLTLHHPSLFLKCISLVLPCSFFVF